MNNKLLRPALAALLMAGALAGPALAQTPARGGYQAEVANCNDGRVDRAACIREAGAARQAARQGALTSPTTDQNALMRCERLPAEDQRACRDRVMGTGNTTIEGSVIGGGLIRETATPVAAPMR